MRTRYRAAGAIGIVLALSVAGCGDAGTTTTIPPTPATTVPSPTTSEDLATTTAAAPTATSAPTATTTSPTTTTEAVTTTTAGVTTTTLAGVPFDHPFFEAGDVLGVVGVAHDDVLNVRSGPGVNQAVVATLAPTAKDIVIVGPHRELPRSFWSEVSADGSTGWVNSGFLAYLGAVDDITSALVSRLGGIPSAADMEALGLLVADAEAYRDEDFSSEIVMVVGPTVGDLGEVTYDVIGLADDSVLGVRLHVFGTPAADGFALKSVEATLLCWRGVTSDGLCV